MIASSSDANQAPDEDVKDEIIDNPNVIAEVKLPENARQSSLFFSYETIKKSNYLIRAKLVFVQGCADA